MELINKTIQKKGTRQVSVISGPRKQTTPCDIDVTCSLIQQNKHGFKAKGFVNANLLDIDFI